MKRTRSEQARAMRKAFEMLKRARAGGEWKNVGDTGPVDPNYAIGAAKEILRNALGITDQPGGNECG